MNDGNKKQVWSKAAFDERSGTDEEIYHKMIEEIEDYAIIRLDENGIIENWNRGAEKIKGYNAGEIIGQHFSIFYLPEDRAQNLPHQLLNKARTDGRAVHEGWRVRKDGTRFWGSITLTALHDDGRQVIGYSKVTRDLTERKTAEDNLKAVAEQLRFKNEALAASEAQYHKMIAEVQDYAIILLDREGNIQNWNIGAEKIKGYTAAEILGKSFQIFYTEEDRLKKLPQQLLTEARCNGRALHEGWRVKKDGSKFWGSIVITALHGDDGEIIGYSKVTRDLTERKHAEDRLKEYLQELKQQNEELDRFAYAASHDLQEPLRKIITFGDLIEQRPDDPAAVSRYIKKILASGDRMLSLIKAVLAYSRLSKRMTEKSETNLNEIFAGVVSDFELLIQEKHAVVNCEPLPVIRAVPQQITQLFSNLIGNALKFSGSSPVINISSSAVVSHSVGYWPQHLPHGTYWQIVFSDNGIGFEPEYAEQIFSLFQRLNHKDEYTGSGIGLAICKKILDNSGGFIRAEGQPGEGATFYVYFPINE